MPVAAEPAAMGGGVGIHSVGMQVIQGAASMPVAVGDDASPGAGVGGAHATTDMQVAQGATSMEDDDEEWLRIDSYLDSLLGEDVFAPMMMEYVPDLFGHSFTDRLLWEFDSVPQLTGYDDE